MRISDALAGRHAATAAPARTRAAFRLPAEGARPARRASMAAPVLGIEMTGMVDEVGERKRRLVRKGRTLLDALDGLKLARLAGRPAAGDLSRLAAESQDDAPSGDPMLDDILAAIRLRAAVELAKSAVKRG